MNKPLLKQLVGIAVAAITIAALASPVSAAPPSRTSDRPIILFPDTENEFVVFLNTTRADFCSDDQVQFELDSARWDAEFGELFFIWIEVLGNDPDDFDPQPPEPSGPEPVGTNEVQSQMIEVHGGEIVYLEKGTVPIELWQLDSFGPGPCTDSASETLIGAGTARLHSNDNDLFGESEKRANSFGGRFNAKLTDADGKSFRYSQRFHVNSRCHGGEEAPPSCLIETTTLR